MPASFFAVSFKAQGLPVIFSKLGEKLQPFFFILLSQTFKKQTCLIFEGPCKIKSNEKDGGKRRKTSSHQSIYQYISELEYSDDCWFPRNGGWTIPPGLGVEVSEGL